MEIPEVASRQLKQLGSERKEIREHEPLAPLPRQVRQLYYMFFKYDPFIFHLRSPYSTLEVSEVALTPGGN